MDLWIRLELWNIALFFLGLAGVISG